MVLHEKGKERKNGSLTTETLGPQEIGIQESSKYIE
jgi:hypothetical protein